MTGRPAASALHPDRLPPGPVHPRRTPVPAAERGATVIPDKVVARIAARAAREALMGHVGEPPGHLGLAAPRCSASVGAGAARLGLSLELPYPIDIARSCLEMQHHVGRRVTQLTGLRVTEVTLTIHRLVPPGGLERRRVH